VTTFRRLIGRFLHSEVWSLTKLILVDKALRNHVKLSCDFQQNIVVFLCNIRANYSLGTIQIDQ
jgi:hypothetical protein